MLEPLLNSIDREIAFYRRRSGQVFFLGVSSEAAIVVGAYQLKVQYYWEHLESILLCYYFFAVAFVGIILGLEYRRRIRYLKENRANLIKMGDYDKSQLIYPSSDQQVVSEIQVLICTLTSISFVSSFLFLLRKYPSNSILIILLILIVASFLLAAYALILCLMKKSPNNF